MFLIEARRLRRIVFAFSCSVVLTSCAVFELNSPSATNDHPVSVTGSVTEVSVMSARISGEEFAYDADGNVQLQRTLSDVEVLSGDQSFTTRGAAARLTKVLDSMAAQHLIRYNKPAPKASRAEDVATFLFAVPIVHASERKRLIGETGVDTIWDSQTHELSMVFHGETGAPPGVVVSYEKGKVAVIQSSTWKSVAGGWVLSSSRADVVVDGVIRWSVIADASDITLVDAPQTPSVVIAYEELPCEDPDGCGGGEGEEALCAWERMQWAWAASAAAAATAYAGYACNNPLLFVFCQQYRDSACAMSNAADLLRAELDRCLG